MPITMNSALTIIALAVAGTSAAIAGTSAYYTWQSAVKEELTTLQNSVEANTTTIGKNTKEINKIIADPLAPKLLHPDVYYLGKVNCGLTTTLAVPKDTTTDDWIVLGISPNIYLTVEGDKEHNNALVGFGTTIVPSPNDKQWTVTFGVYANLGIGKQGNEVQKCKNSIFADQSNTGEAPHIHVVAFRKARK